MREFHKREERRLQKLNIELAVTFTHLKCKMTRSKCQSKKELEFVKSRYQCGKLIKQITTIISTVKTQVSPVKALEK